VSSLERTFEVRILINGIAKMFHLKNLKSQQQAETRALKMAKKKNGRVLTIRKVNVDDWPSGIELMKLEQQPRGLYLGGKVWESDVSVGGELDLDQILGISKKKSQNRKKYP
jgi:hypothetical protein